MSLGVIIELSKTCHSPSPCLHLPYPGLPLPLPPSTSISLSSSSPLPLSPLLSHLSPSLFLSFSLYLLSFYFPFTLSLSPSLFPIPLSLLLFLALPPSALSLFLPCGCVSTRELSADTPMSCLAPRCHAPHYEGSEFPEIISYK